MEFVTLPAAAGIPPHVAQVPTAITAAALGARSLSQCAVGMGLWRPSSLYSIPIADQ